MIQLIQVKVKVIINLSF